MATTSGNYKSSRRHTTVHQLHPSVPAHAAGSTHSLSTVLSTYSKLPTPSNIIPSEKLIKIKGSATSAFLSKMGYPCTFPCAIMYASTHHGSLTFWHLGHEQGVQQCLQLIKHIQANTTTGQTYQILIQQYQLYTGFNHLILEKLMLYNGVLPPGWTISKSSCTISKDKLFKKSMDTPTTLPEWLHNYGRHTGIPFSLSQSYPTQQCKTFPLDQLPLKNHWPHQNLTPALRITPSTAT